MIATASTQVNMTRTICGINEIDPVAPTLVTSTCVNMYLGVMIEILTS